MSKEAECTTFLDNLLSGMCYTPKLIWEMLIEVFPMRRLPTNMETL